jgi:hypothetical protein
MNGKSHLTFVVMEGGYLQESRRLAYAVKFGLSASAVVGVMIHQRLQHAGERS